jgi:hypothetical protein
MPQIATAVSHPKYCILGEAKEIHTVCACDIPQNIALMLQGAHLTADFSA